jgi:hypothetical protein
VTFGRFARDLSGNVAILFALLLPVLVGGGGLAVDYAYYTMVKGELQGAADAAAAAGAISLPSDTAAKTAALQLAHLNVAASLGTVAEERDVELGIYNSVDRSFTVSPVAPNAVRVTTGRTVARGNAPPAMFSAIWGYEHQEIHAVAIAVLLQSNQHCIYALNASASAAFYMTGESQLLLPTCGVQVNSSSSTAAQTTGASSVTSDVFHLVGGYSGGGFNPVPTKHTPQSDPYADVPEPIVPPACTYTDWNFDFSKVFPAGTRFCGKTKFKNGSFTFAPGIHYFTGTSVSFETNGDVIAMNAMFYIGPDVDFRMAAKGVTRISAMQTGPYAGIAIFQSRNSLTPPTMLIEGGASLQVDAAIYAPKTHLDMGGKSVVDFTIGNLIADTMMFRGKSRFNVASQLSRPTGAAQSALVR